MYVCTGVKTIRDKQTIIHTKTSASDEIALEPGRAFKARRRRARGYIFAMTTHSDDVNNQLSRRS